MNESLKGVVPARMELEDGKFLPSDLRFPITLDSQDKRADAIDIAESLLHAEYGKLKVSPSSNEFDTSCNAFEARFDLFTLSEITRILSQDEVICDDDSEHVDNDQLREILTVALEKINLNAEEIYGRAFDLGIIPSPSLEACKYFISNDGMEVADKDAIVQLFFYVRYFEEILKDKLETAVRNGFFPTDYFEGMSKKDDFVLADVISSRCEALRRAASLVEEVTANIEQLNVGIETDCLALFQPPYVPRVDVSSEVG